MKWARGIGLALIERAKAVEASLWRRLRFNDEIRCRTRLFERYVELARAVARGEQRRRPSYGLERGDFEQLAFGGLIEAIDRFDPVRGSPFEAYARPRIKGAISDGVERSSEAGAMFAFRRRIENERMRSLAHEGAGASSVDPVGELAALVATIAIGLIAEASANAGPDAPLDAYESVAFRDFKLRVIREISKLSEAQRTIIEHHYFLGVAFNEIAQTLKLSKGRISQLHRGALQRLRERLTHPKE